METTPTIYRNNRGQRITPVPVQPIVIYTKSDVSLYRINEPVYSEDGSEQYTLASLDYYGSGHNCYARLVLVPSLPIAAD